jgi:anti-sigma factor (TIGR02949 family)
MKRQPDYLDCRRALELLYDYFDGEVPPSDAEYVRRHIELCNQCLKRFHYEGDLLKRIRSAAKKSKAPAQLRKRVLEMCRGTPQK